MTRFTKMARKTHVEASEWSELKGGASEAKEPETSLPQKRTAEKDEKKAKRVRHRSKLLQKDGGSAEGPDDDHSPDTRKLGGIGNETSLTKKEREILKRRSRREKTKERKMTCFLCRQSGHSIKFCPRSPDAAKASASVTDNLTEDSIDLDAIAREMDPTLKAGNAVEGICYRCGSAEHTSKECRKKVHSDNPYPFATCFICSQKGHITSQCPKNDKGVYPNGGCCKFCGSVQHLSSACKPASMAAGVTTLGVMDLKQGGDDDDVFVALKKMKEEKEESGATGVMSGAKKAGMSALKKVKKVVKF